MRKWLQRKTMGICSSSIFIYNHQAAFINPPSRTFIWAGPGSSDGRLVWTEQHGGSVCVVCVSCVSCVSCVCFEHTHRHTHLWHVFINSYRRCNTKTMKSISLCFTPALFTPVYSMETETCCFTFIQRIKRNTLFKLTLQASYKLYIDCLCLKMLKTEMNCPGCVCDILEFTANLSTSYCLILINTFHYQYAQT